MIGVTTGCDSISIYYLLSLLRLFMPLSNPIKSVLFVIFIITNIMLQPLFKYVYYEFR
jgi:hypothetical protein